MARFREPEDYPRYGEGASLDDGDEASRDDVDAGDYSTYPEEKYDSIMEEMYSKDEQRSVLVNTQGPAHVPRHTMDSFVATRIDPRDKHFETFDDTEPVKPQQVQDLRRFGPAKILPTPVSHEIRPHSAYSEAYPRSYDDRESSYDEQHPTPQSDAYDSYAFHDQYPDASSGDRPYAEEAPYTIDTTESYGQHRDPNEPKEPNAPVTASGDDQNQYPWSSTDGYEGWPKDGGGFSLPQRGTDTGSQDMRVTQMSTDGDQGSSPRGSSSGSDSLLTERCKEFHLKELAEHIVKGALRTAVQDLSYERGEDWRYRTAGTEGPNVEWPPNYGFTSLDGERKIDEFLDTWGIGDAWYHCVDFLHKGSDVYADYYYYEAKWSIPTRSYPIPQATVSVFFTIEVSKKEPDECPVVVKFQFETDPYIHVPGDCKIREEWIHDTLKRKIAFFRTLTF